MSRILNRPDLLATRFLVCALMGAALFAGCSDEDDTLAVTVCGDLSIPQHADQVRVSVLDETGTELSSGLRELVTCPGAEGVELPQTLDMPMPGGKGVVKVQALRDGVTVVEFTRNVDFNNSDEVSLPLNVDCFSLFCATGQTCIGGRCEISPYDSDAVTCQSTGEAPDLSDIPDVTYCGGEVVVGGEGEGEGEGESE